MRNILPVALLVGLFVSLGTATARADILTYTESATASGALDGTAFSDALVTLMLTGNTSDISSAFGGTLFYLAGPTTVSVAGIGTDTFTDSVPVFDNQLHPFAGFFLQCAPPAAPTCGEVVLATVDNAFASYDLSTPIGPITDADTGASSSPLVLKTVGGTFDMTSMSADATFTVTTPEPSSLLLLATGLIGLGLLTRRRLLAA